MDATVEVKMPVELLGKLERHCEELHVEVGEYIVELIRVSIESKELKQIWRDNIKRTLEEMK